MSLNIEMKGQIKIILFVDEREEI